MCMIVALCVDSGHLEASEEEKDGRVMIATTLKPSLQCSKDAKKANQVQ